MSGPGPERFAWESRGEGKEPDKERTRRKRRLTAGKTKTKPRGKCGASREPSGRCFRTARTHTRIPAPLTSGPMSTTHLREQGQGEKLRDGGNGRLRVSANNSRKRAGHCPSSSSSRRSESFHHSCPLTLRHIGIDVGRAKVKRQLLIGSGAWLLVTSW